MTAATPTMITRCPKCGTAFRVTSSQLQSAKGAVRCGSCLHVFKAEEYRVITKPEPEPATEKQAQAAHQNIIHTNALSLKRPNFNDDIDRNDMSATEDAINSALTAHDAAKSAQPNADAADHTDYSLDVDADDLLISDDMEHEDTGASKYEFDGFMDVELKPANDISLFERKIRPAKEQEIDLNTDESWAEMLIEDEDLDEPKLAVARTKSEEELADDALMESHKSSSSDAGPTYSSSTAPASTKPAGANPDQPKPLFSIIGEEPGKNSDDELVVSDELAQIPSYSGFNNKPSNNSAPSAKSQDDTGEQNEESPKRQLKTQPKIRAYDNSRSALLMNIMPAPIEFTSKGMHRWYQRKLWPALSLVALIALAGQFAWFKFDHLSRIEPYRSAYQLICPSLGCELPTLVDTRQITTSNLVVREHPDADNALAVDVMIINGAGFDQPFPDLVLVFSDIDDTLVASRRFTAKDYLGGELINTELMPQNQKVYITLDIVDPGPDAVNYRIFIPRQ